MVAYSSSFGDGINQSVPAPGIGLLACAAETAGAATHGACDFVARRAAIAQLEQQRSTLETLLGPREAAQLVADGKRRHGHDFAQGRSDISPLRAALGVFGLDADDIAVVSKHDTSTAANDVNENRVHTWLQEKLGRTPGWPLMVVSQKSLTGHPKGAAAAWQMNGLLQAMADGVVPGNRSIDDVDGAMREFQPLVFNDRPLEVGPLGIRAGLVTSLGFGHVGSIVCLVHPFMFWRMLSDGERGAYETAVRARSQRATRRLQAATTGAQPMFRRRLDRPFAGRDGTLAQQRHEASVLTDADARLPVGSSLYPERSPR
jgi:3-oxoacyl-(acyl-carrier-protein) synthase